MAEFLSSKTVVQEEPAALQPLDRPQVAVGAMVLVTEKGPVGVPTLLTSFDEFRDIFGSYITNGDGVISVEGFFANGGQFLYVVRTVHYTDPAIASSKTSAAGTITASTPATAATAGVVLGTNVAPFDLTPGDTLVGSVDGNPDDTATIDAAAASRASNNTETFDLADGLTLTVSIDGGSVQTITFNTAEFADIANATALEVAAVINAEIVGAQATVSAGAVVITSDKEGTDSGVNVTGGTANSGGVNRLDFTTGNVAGTGDVADINAVTVAEIKTLVEAAWTGGSGVTVNDVGGAVRIVSNTTGVSSSVQVAASSTADDELGLDNATHSGTSGAATPTLRIDAKYDGASPISVRVDDATSGEADEFNLVVLDDGVEVESFPNLSMVDTEDRFGEVVVNQGAEESNWITVTDLDAGVSDQRPANGTYVLAGGDDGLTGLVDADYVGAAAENTGLRALDTVRFQLLGVPGQATSTVHNAMITYVETTRSGMAIAILDPPASQSAQQIVTYHKTTAALFKLSEYFGLFWPRPKILNPSTTVFGTDTQLVIPPSGDIMGKYAAQASNFVGGVYKPVAGIEEGRIPGGRLNNRIVGFETDEQDNERKRDIVFPAWINILRKDDRTGQVYIDGARSGNPSGIFPYLSQRRGVNFLEEAVQAFLERYRHKNVSEKDRRDAERSIEAFLRDEMEVDAFASTTQEEAFFISLSAKLNPATKKNFLTARMGLAMNTPKEFIILRVSNDTREIDQAEAA